MKGFVVKIKFVRVFISLIAITCLLNSTVFAANWKDVEFVNLTGKTIYKLYFTDSGKGDWGRDFLGDSMLPNGNSKTLRYNADVTYFDFKIDFDSNGNGYNWRQFNFSGAWRITFYPNGSGGYKAIKN